MRLIQGINDQPNQTITIPIDGGTVATWTLSYKALQKGWFYNLAWNGAPVCSGARLVASPNILRQFLNKIPFGLLISTENEVEPTAINDLVNGLTKIYLLQGSDLSLVETAAFGAIPDSVEPLDVSVGGSGAPVLPDAWGPAGGDLRKTYPNPEVGAIHTSDGVQLLINLIPDGTYVKRSGALLVGSVPPGGGDVLGPAGAIAGHIAVFADGTGKVLADGGAIGSSTPTGPAGGDLGGTYPNPKVIALETTTGGGTQLTIAGIGDGQLVKRVGSTLVGVDAPSSTPTGPASGDLGGTYPNPKVAAITTGVTQLTIGSIADGQYVKRVGTTLVGGNPAGTGDVTGPASSASGNIAVFNGGTGKLLQDTGLNLGNSTANLAVSTAVGDIFQAQLFNLPAELAYPTAGAIAINLSANNRAHINLTGNFTLSVTGMTAKSFFVLTLKNASGVEIDSNWPAWVVSGNGVFRSSMKAGATKTIFITGAGTTLGTVTAQNVLPIQDGSADLNVSTMVVDIIQPNLINWITELAYPTFGSIVINAGANNRAAINLTGDFTLSFGGVSSRMFFLLTLKNATALFVTATWPAWVITNGGTLPTSLAPGQTYSLLIQATGSTPSSMTVFYAGAGGGGVTLVSGGRGMLHNAITSTGSIDAELYVYNVTYFGAKGDNVQDDWNFIQNGAIAAGISSGKPFALYFPSGPNGGRYKISKKLSIALALQGQSVIVFGDGIGASQLVFTDTGVDCGIEITRNFPFRGGYLTDGQPSVHDISIISSSVASGTRGLLFKLSAGLIDSGTQGARIFNVGFFSSVDGKFWDFAIELDNWSQVTVRDCNLGSGTASVFIHGNNGVTSCFWILDNQMQGGVYGVFVDGRGDVYNRIEGIFVRGNSFLVVNTAVWVENSNTGGGLEVTGGQINCKNGSGAGVHVVGIAGIVIQGVCSFNNANGPGGGFWNGIEILDGCWGAMISGNKIDLAANSGYGVYIKNAGTPPGGGTNTVTGNSFGGFGAFGNVKLDGGANRTIVALNTSDGGAYIDASGGGGNLVINNI